MTSTIMLIFSFFVVWLVIFNYHKTLMEHPRTYYVVSWLIGLATFAAMIYLQFFVDHLPEHFYDAWYMMPYRLVSRGFLGAAIWTFVMFANYIPNQDMRQKLMATRTELSIIGTIISLPQALVYSTFVIEWFSRSLFYQISAGLLLLIVVLLIVLGYTSMAGPKQRMGTANWKRLHKLSYLYYFLIYLEWVLISVLRALRMTAGTADFYATWLRVGLYLLLYASYLLLKYRKVFRRARAAT